MTMPQGYFDPRFASVRELFAEQMADPQARGAALCVTVGNETVLDLWQGVMDKDNSQVWEQDTLVNVFSCTKPLGAVALLQQVEAGRIGLDSPLAEVWPEFAAAGKQAVTLRQVLGHRSALSAVAKPLPPEALFDWQAMVAALEQQEPWWTPGSAHGYAPVSYAWLLGEPLRRVSGQRPGAYINQHICAALGMDFFVGVPDAELDRVAHVSRLRNQYGDEYARALFAAMGQPDSLAAKAFGNPSSMMTSTNTREWKQAEIFSANGTGNARSLARFWQVLAHGGNLDGVHLLDSELVGLMAQEHSQGMDCTLLAPTRFGLGVMLEQDYEGGGFGMGPQAWGHPGAGGALGFCDPQAQVGFGYVTNTMGPYVLMDPRALALSREVYRCLRQLD
ncbi:serine hydrolase domain-containing protein [Pseudomonas jilinensis]|uniref:EstA family serine hydrolase n=1 Tax=Pseudomonas jilinensis TaxID=2078689 RepID=A0A396RYK5_9PSED|nr:serine hydrolase domain-containing protein [Pseudomonas jilinensis]RHW21730.1 EstA family serine hydrolase [Pseudomonas jilinensis]